MSRLFPWQMKQWQQLWQAHERKSMPHGLLFQGVSGLGKKKFADEWARALLCQKLESRGEGCGDCHACRLIEGRVHPNVMWVEPEEEGQTIKVDQIRLITEFINQSSIQGEYRIVIIHPADKMNMQAANALLKTLEEPSQGSLLILVTNQAEQLPATLLSRVQRVSFQHPPEEIALAWLSQQFKKKDQQLDLRLALQLANGGPLAAIQMVKDKTFALRTELFQALFKLSSKEADPLKVAADFQDAEVLILLDFIATGMLDVLRLQLGGGNDFIVNRDYAQQLSLLSQKTALSKNRDYLDYLQKVREQLCLGMNMNKQLMLECALIRWMELSPHVSG